MMTTQSEVYLSNLVQKAQQGDRAALNQLCKEVENVLRGYFWSKFQDNNIVDDLAQEAYIRLYHSFQNVKEPMKFRSFVTKIAIHVSQDFIRQKYRTQEQSLEAFSKMNNDSSSTKEKAVDFVELDVEVIKNIDLKNAMEKLSEKARQILLMKIDGFKYEEIAKEVGISVSGVKMQVQRSLEFLRSLLLYVTFFVFISTILIKVMG